MVGRSGGGRGTVGRLKNLDGDDTRAEIVARHPFRSGAL